MRVPESEDGVTGCVGGRSRSGGRRASPSLGLSPSLLFPAQENERWCLQDLAICREEEGGGRRDPGRLGSAGSPGERRYLEAGAASLAPGPGGARCDHVTP